MRSSSAWISPARLEWASMTTSGTPAMAQCPRRPEGPGSATMP